MCTLSFTLNVHWIYNMSRSNSLKTTIDYIQLTIVSYLEFYLQYPILGSNIWANETNRIVTNTCFVYHNRKSTKRLHSIDFCRHWSRTLDDTQNGSLQPIEHNLNFKQKALFSISSIDTHICIWRWICFFSVNERSYVSWSSILLNIFFFGNMLTFSWHNRKHL